MTRRVLRWLVARFRRLGPYTLPMIGLTALTAGAAQYGPGPGLITGGVSTILLEWQRRTDLLGGRAPEGDE